MTEETDHKPHAEEKTEMHSEPREPVDQDGGKSKKKKGGAVKTPDARDQKIAELDDKYLRLSAEFDNYRKRTLKEKMDLVKTGGETVLMGILPVVDNLERAMQVIRQARDLEAVKEGVELIHLKFKDFLAQNGIREIECMNKELDTDIHEAVTKTPAQDSSLQGKVVDVIEKGYYLHDRVIRYAKVVIGE